MCHSGESKILGSLTVVGTDTQAVRKAPASCLFVWLWTHFGNTAASRPYEAQTEEFTGVQMLSDVQLIH